jgi:hypothetical protein
VNRAAVFFRRCYFKDISMDEQDFDGTLVLEKLARLGKLEAFMDAVDYDDFKKAERLMKAAGIDKKTIETVLKEMNDSGH